MNLDSALRLCSVLVLSHLTLHLALFGSYYAVFKYPCELI